MGLAAILVSIRGLGFGGELGKICCRRLSLYRYLFFIAYLQAGIMLLHSQIL
jgi:hypothetical protein